MNKIALIYGNGSYPESPLKNPVNDAKSIKEKLANLGFYCIMRTNVKVQEMDRSLTECAEKLQENEVGLFFFAGHGMQIDGRNYLTAVDTNFKTERDAKYSSLALDKVIEVMEDTNNLTKIIILDACRNNPYERRWRGIETRGLAPIYAPKGMIIAYATSPGQVASDGEDKNGAYTKALLQHISTQDITIEDLFKRVRNTLSSITKGRQISWEHTSLMGDFYFNYSMVTDELITEYSSEALADHFYKPVDSPVDNIVIALRSHNWYTQNPAIDQIWNTDLDTAEKDELFVLGRNIYQAGCGGSHSAENFLSRLDVELSGTDANAVFHIFNGMLYEIYFDSQGRKRESCKADMIDQVFSIANKTSYSKSFKFIRQALKPYAKELFYMPGQITDIVIDITTEILEDGKRGISGLFYGGDNILYEEEGKSYFELQEDNLLREKNLAEIHEWISQGVVTPSYRLKINYVDVDPSRASLLVPFHSSKI